MSEPKFPPMMQWYPVGNAYGNQRLQSQALLARGNQHLDRFEAGAAVAFGILGMFQALHDRYYCNHQFGGFCDACGEDLP